MKETRGKLRIGVGGSAASPITIAHVALLEALAGSGLFDHLIWIPSGERSDKPGLPNGAIRKAMTICALGSAWQETLRTPIEIRYDDVCGVNMPTADWFRKLERERPDADIMWYTGVDSVMPVSEDDLRSQIEATWDEGEDLMRNRSFLIIPRKGYPHPRMLSLPSQFSILDVDVPDCSSTYVRTLIASGEQFEHLVPPGVDALIKAYRLYGYQPNSTQGE